MQRYKFESNSQQITSTHSFATVVYANAKIQIWKQFTTSQRQAHLWLMLFMPMQRYKFESNSQLQNLFKSWRYSCLCQCKDTNLKAIHNWRTVFPTTRTVVYANAKIQIWKQFTTCRWQTCESLCCLCQCKDTNLKAIHNLSVSVSGNSSVVYANAKIQIWKQFTTV